MSIALLLSACIWDGSHVHRHGPDKGTSPVAAVVAPTDAEACAAVRMIPPVKDAQKLDGSHIHLLNWNTQKHGHHSLHADLVRFSDEADLILLQEAVVDTDHLRAVDGGFHWVFAPGYRKSGTTTGVMTASRVAPIGYCKLASTEPWLGSPKATSVTRYALSGRDDTLLVINLHLINFTVGVAAMEQQLRAALDFATAHEGPVIVSGDFNTWSKKRARIVAGELSNEGLQPVRFPDDGRTRIFGRPVDHIFVRGLRATSADTYAVGSSDHNPLSTVLQVL
jgi:endonuclease/exonuclease/phosphatase (EEP) superfamily protein YafD